MPVESAVSLFPLRVSHEFELPNLLNWACFGSAVASTSKSSARRWILRRAAPCACQRPLPFRHVAARRGRAWISSVAASSAPRSVGERGHHKRGSSPKQRSSGLRAAASCRRLGSASASRFVGACLGPRPAPRSRRYAWIPGAAERSRRRRRVALHRPNLGCVLRLGIEWRATRGRVAPRPRWPTRLDLLAGLGTANT